MLQQHRPYKGLSLPYKETPDHFSTRSFSAFPGLFQGRRCGKNTKCKERNQRWLKSIWLLQFKGPAIVHAARCRGLLGHLQDKAIVNIIRNTIYLCQDQTEWRVGRITEFLSCLS